MAFDVIFVSQFGRCAAPTQVRCYRFAECLERAGMRTRVLSMVDHLGSGEMGGSSPPRPVLDHQKLMLDAQAAEILLQNPDSVLYLQKPFHNALAVFCAAATNNNPFILDYDDFDFEATGHILPQLARFLPGLTAPEMFRAAARHAAEIVVSSPKLQEIIRQQGFDATLIPTGCDLRSFDPTVPPLLAPQPEGRVRIWWGGDMWNTEIANSLQQVFEAVAHLPPVLRQQVEMILCGSGVCYEPFRQMVQQRYGGLFAINILGRIDPAEMPRFLNSIDIGVVPLFKDNFFNQCKSPTKLFELMAMGKPVIGTQCGFLSSIIEDGRSGFLAETIEDWASRIGLLVENQILRQLMGQQARERVERHYSLQVLTDPLVKVIERAKRKRGQGPKA